MRYTKWRPYLIFLIENFVQRVDDSLDLAVVFFFYFSPEKNHSVKHVSDRKDHVGPLFSILSGLVLINIKSLKEEKNSIYCLFYKFVEW